MKKEQSIAYYKSILPKRIHVQVISDEEGIWASIDELPDCYTQPDGIDGLPAMLTDLLYTHYKVPVKFYNQLGIYLPLTDNRLRWDDAIRMLVNIEARTQAGEEVEETFARKFLSRK